MKTIAQNNAESRKKMKAAHKGKQIEGFARKSDGRIVMWAIGKPTKPALYRAAY